MSLENALVATLKQIIAITAVLRYHKINTVYSRPRRALLGCLEVLGISYYINYAFKLFVHGIVWYCRDPLIAYVKVSFTSLVHY